MLYEVITEWKNKKTGEISKMELYDHSTSDIATENLAYKDENKQLVTELSQMIKDGWKAALPEKQK